MEFTADGRFFLMGDAPNSLDLGRLTDGASSGTFSVVDASPTLGPGAFQVRFSAGNGGVFLQQVAVLGSPSRLRFFAPAAADFVPAVSLSYQAGVCGPSFVMPSACQDQGDLLTRLQGRWLSCGGSTPLDIAWRGPTPPPPFVGVEIQGSTITGLVIDATGSVVPDTTYSGPLVLLSPGQSGVIMFGGQGHSAVTQVMTAAVVDACDRAMVFGPPRICDNWSTTVTATTRTRSSVCLERRQRPSPRAGPIDREGRCGAG